MSAERHPVQAWRAAGVGTALVAWRDAQRAALGRHVDAALQRWANQWALGAHGLASVTCIPADSAFAREKWREVCAWRPGVWVASDSDDLRDMRRALFGQETCSPAAEEVARRCRDDAVAHVAACLREDVRSGNAPVPGDCTGPWCGALDLILPFGVRLRMHRDTVEGLLRTIGVVESDAAAPGEPLAAVSAAVEDLTLAVSVRLNACELDVGSLHALQVGDVLRIQHGIDTPAMVFDAEGRTMCRAFLVRHGSHAAVELAPAGAQ